MRLVRRPMARGALGLWVAVLLLGAAYPAGAGADTRTRTFTFTNRLPIVFDFCITDPLCDSPRPTEPYPVRSLSRASPVTSWA